jgi:hypothetical protein
MLNYKKTCVLREKSKAGINLDYQNSVRLSSKQLKSLGPVFFDLENPI